MSLPAYLLKKNYLPFQSTSSAPRFLVGIVFILLNCMFFNSELWCVLQFQCKTMFRSSFLLHVLCGWVYVLYMNVKLYFKHILLFNNKQLCPIQLFIIEQ